MRSYIKRFFDTRATIANIADDDVIDCFHNGLVAQQLYRDFGRNRLRSVVALRDMMLAWADQEEQERDRFPRRKDNNQKHNGDSRSDKGQRNFDKKQKPKDTVATMERGQKGNPQDDFQKLLDRPYPLHPKEKHTILECVSLRKSLQQCQLEEDKKKKDKQDVVDGDKDGTMGFQQPANRVNMIYGGDSSFYRRNQKLVWREILKMELAVQKPLRHSETPITFSREDQWTSFSEPGKFPLVLDPVIAGSILTRVLIDGGSGLNLIFMSTITKIGLDISDKLKPSKAPFYGIVPGNASFPVGTVVLPVTFGTPDNYRTELIKFEVADFESSYHAILGRPALAKFMAIPHYVYLLLKMPGKPGVLTFRRDLQRSFECEKEAITYASTNRLPDTAEEVLAAAQLYTASGSEIPTKKTNRSASKSPDDIGVKAIQLQEYDPSKTALIGTGLSDK